MSDLRIVPISWEEACEFIDALHRTHRRPTGHKFSIGVADGDQIVGVATIGRPVAAAFQDGLTLEVNRTCTDGTKNANSMLYGSAWRAAKAMGYRRLITYTQEGESGSSLRGAGWMIVNQLRPRKGWDTPTRRRAPGVDHVARTLWEVMDDDARSLMT